jgi:nucleoside-diphosphate-sugar epimerase
MKTLVTGGSGHLGANLVRELLARGQESIRVLVHADSRGLDGLDVEPVRGDLRDPESLQRAVRGCQRVYHVAAFVSLRNADRQQIFDVNVLGTRYLLRAALDAGVERVVHCSSFGAVGRNPNGASDESWTINPFEEALDYERSKAFAEHEVLQAAVDGLDVVMVNPSGMVGPYDFKPSFVGQTILDFAHGKMKAYVPGAFDFVPVRDVVQGHLLAMQKGRRGKRYLLTGSVATIDQILDWLEQLTGVKRPRVKLGPQLMQRVAVVKDWVESRWFPDQLPRFNQHSIRLLNSGKHGDNTLARSELGLEPTPVRDAFRDAVEWFAEAGLLRRKIPG